MPNNSTSKINLHEGPAEYYQYNGSTLVDYNSPSSSIFTQTIRTVNVTSNNIANIAGQVGGQMLPQGQEGDILVFSSEYQRWVPIQIDLGAQPPITVQGLPEGNNGDILVYNSALKTWEARSALTGGGNIADDGTLDTFPWGSGLDVNGGFF